MKKLNKMNDEDSKDSFYVEEEVVAVTIEAEMEIVYQILRNANIEDPYSTMYRFQGKLFYA